MNTLILIKEKGFQGTSVSLIAERAEVAVGTIYHYFATKDILIAELYDMIRKEMLAAMFDNTVEINDFKAQFFKGWKGLCKYFIEHPNSLVFIEQYNCSPYFKENEQDCGVIPQNQFYEFFQYGVSNGILKKMEYNLIASVVFGGILSTAKYHLSGRFGHYSDDELCKIALMIWDGIKSQ